MSNLFLEHEQSSNCNIKKFKRTIVNIFPWNTITKIGEDNREMNRVYLWDRLLRSLRAVAPTARFLCPRFIRSITSKVDDTETRLASGTLSPLWELLRISNVLMIKGNIMNRDESFFFFSLWEELNQYLLKLLKAAVNDTYVLVIFKVIQDLKVYLIFFSKENQITDERISSVCSISDQ